MLLAIPILLGVAALADAEAQAKPDDFGTGKISVEGSLSVNFASPRAETSVILYFSVTPLVSTDVWTQFLLPENVVPLENEVVERKFPRVEALETVTHTLKVKVLSEDRTVIQAVAAITDEGDEGVYLSRGFQTILGDDENTKSSAAHSGTSASGKRLVVFDSGTGKSPD